MSKMDKARIGELGKTYSGLSGKTKEDFGTGQPFITYMNVFSSGKIDPAMMDRVQINRGERQNNAVYGDIFFTTSSETVEDVGTSSVMLYEPPVATYLNSFCFGFRLHNFDRLHPEFAAYLLRGQAARKAISDLGQGSTRYNLPKTVFLERVVLEFPPLPVQRKIARILTTLDNLIEKTEALIAKYQAIKQGMMHDLFTRGVDSSGQLRPTQQQAPDLYKQSELGWIPKEWEVQVITDCCAAVFLGLTSKVDYVDEGGVPLVRATDISGGSLSFKKALSISHRQHKSLTKYRKAKRGDVLVSKSGSLGVCAVVETDREFSIYESIIVLQPVADKLNSNFLVSLMRHQDTQTRLLGETVGSTVGHLNLTHFRRLLVPIPPLAEQCLISEVISAQERSIENEAKALNKFRMLKNGLMQDLLTGKVRVKVDEAEEVATHA